MASLPGIEGLVFLGLSQSISLADRFGALQPKASHFYDGFKHKS